MCCEVGEDNKERTEGRDRFWLSPLPGHSPCPCSGCLVSLWVYPVNYSEATYSPIWGPVLGSLPLFLLGSL